jgi:hypothetical protein
MENHDGKSLYANIHAGFRSFNGVMDKVFFFPDPSVNFAMENLDEKWPNPSVARLSAFFIAGLFRSFPFLT